MRFEYIWNWIEENKPEVILETGTWSGVHARKMLACGAKRYVGFDVWDEGSDELDEIENNVKKRVAEKDVRESLKEFDVELIQGNTRMTLPQYVQGKDRFVDMAFLDGGHSKTTMRSDLLNIMKIMKPTGVIFLDDYYFNCPKQGVGAQTIMGEINVPYLVLPKVDKAKDGSLIKIVRIDMKDVPRQQEWDIPDEQSWKFDPEGMK